MGCLPEVFLSDNVHAVKIALLAEKNLMEAIAYIASNNLSSKSLVFKKLVKEAKRLSTKPNILVNEIKTAEGHNCDKEKRLNVMQTKEKDGIEINAHANLSQSLIGDINNIQRYNLNKEPGRTNLHRIELDSVRSSFNESLPQVQAEEMTNAQGLKFYQKPSVDVVTIKAPSFFDLSIEANLPYILEKLKSEANEMYIDAYKNYFLKYSSALRYNLCFASSSPYFKATILLAKLGESYADFISIKEFFDFLIRASGIGLKKTEFIFPFLTVTLGSDFNEFFLKRWNELQSGETPGGEQLREQAQMSFEYRNYSFR